MLGRDVVVLERARLFLGALEYAHQRRRGCDALLRGGIAARVDARDTVDQLVDAIAERARGRAQSLDERKDDPLRIGQKPV